MAVTILEVFEARRAASGLGVLDAYSAADFHAQGLAMMGGCVGCAAFLVASTAYPDRCGYWSCEGCLRRGFETVVDFETDLSEHLGCSCEVPEEGDCVVHGPRQ